MPEWTKELLGWLLAPTGIFAAAVGWYFKSRREDKIKEETRREGVVRALEERSERLQAKVESLLMDAFARERENNAQMVERIAMDKQQNEVIAAATVALREATAALAKLKDGT